MSSGIYEIINLVTQKRYVGSAIDFTRRWKAHWFHLNKGTHHSQHMQSAWTKHGAQAFQFRRLILCSEENLLMYEQIALDALAPEYNTLRVAGSCLGMKLSAESRAKISAANMGNTATLGYKHTQETKAKIRATQLGRVSASKGLPRDRKAVEATATAHRGMRRSEQTRARISAAMTGRKFDPEVIARRVATNLKNRAAKLLK